VTKSDLVHVSSYERRVHASLERAWENVLDWEHLPWLHSGSFASIAMEEAGEWGWRARVTPRQGSEFRLELLVEREAGRYVSRTIEGPGAGTEIWTRLRSAGSRCTDVAVTFHVPEAPPEHADALGHAFVALYTRLWDEDEQMMRHRSEELAKLGAEQPPKEPVALGPLDGLRERLPLCVEHAGRRYRVLDCDGELVAHAVTCPHMLGPLDQSLPVDGCLRCPWHGYSFDVRTGQSTDGRKLRLPPAPPVGVDAAGHCWLGGEGAPC